MHTRADEEIAAHLIGIIADGFNRSLGALSDAGAIDTRKMQKQYCGIGSRYYDLVTEQIVLTARYCAPSVRRFFTQDGAPA